MHFRDILRARKTHYLLLLVVGWSAFAFRFATPDFTNDDFDHLSKARQVLFGELPDRDFYDDGRPLTILASAAVQYLSPTLFAELVFRVAAIAAGVAMVYALARAISGSSLLGVLAALLTAAMHPRLYNYPKVLLFPCAVWLLWRYIDRPSRRHLTELALLTVVAFLFRYDFGVYIGFVSVVILAATHRAGMTKPLAWYFACGLVCTVPYLAWLASNGRFLSTGSGGLTSMLRQFPGISRAPVTLDLSRGLFFIAPRPPQIGVRWSPDVDSATRVALEQRYGLEPRGLRQEERSVRYFMGDPSEARLKAVLADPRVEDTNGIDRGSGRLLDLTWNRWQLRLPLFRVTPAPVFHTREDAQGWIYYVYMAAVPLALVLWWLFPDRTDPNRGPKLIALGLLCVVIDQLLIQGSLDSRLPDVTGLNTVFLAWVVARVAHIARLQSGLGGMLARAAVFGVLLTLTVVTWFAVAFYGETRLARVITSGAVMPSKLAQVTRTLNVRPLDYWTSTGSTGIPALVRYVAQCLAPGDRPLIIGYVPEAYYVSERLFPGGVNKFDHGNFNSSSDEVMKRLRGQSVPLVVVDRRFDDDFANDWPGVARYVSARYREAAVTGFNKEIPFRILADSQRRPVRVDPQWGLPCWTDQ